MYVGGGGGPWFHYRQMELVSWLIRGKATLVSERKARRIDVGCGSKGCQCVCVCVTCVCAHDCVGWGGKLPFVWSNKRTTCLVTVRICECGVCVYAHTTVLAYIKYWSVCARAVVSLPVWVQGCLRVCGCKDPLLAAAVKAEEGLTWALILCWMSSYIVAFPQVQIRERERKRRREISISHRNELYACAYVGTSAYMYMGKTHLLSSLTHWFDYKDYGSDIQ